MTEKIEADERAWRNVTPDANSAADSAPDERWATGVFGITSEYAVTRPLHAPKTYDGLVTLAYILDTRDRPTLLFAMMRALASNRSKIAFEGNLDGTELFTLDGASHEEAGQLKRATIAPRLDFVVLPLSPSSLDQVERAIRSKVAFGGQRGIIHVQIEVDGQLAFAAYDNFGSGAVVVDDAAVSRELLDDLVGNRALRGYSERRKV